MAERDWLALLSGLALAAPLQPGVYDVSDRQAVSVGCKSASGSGTPSGPADQALSVFERTYNHCMGLYASADGRTLWLASRFQIWRLEQASAGAVPYRPAEVSETATQGKSPPSWVGRGFDFAYIPRIGYTTGHLDVHDLAVDADGRLIFVNTMFGCLATLSERASFQPLWKPPFLSALVPEDRCHLNGLAMRDGRPAFLTVVSRSDVADGWRDKRHDGGCVLDVATGEAVCTGLSMPHSPRWHKGKLWVLNSGTGEIGHVELPEGRFFPRWHFARGICAGWRFRGTTRS